MANPVFIAVNQTGSPLVLTELALTVPASGQVTLSGFNSTSEIQDDGDLKKLIDDDTLLINDGTTTLSKAASLQYVTTATSTSGASIDSHVEGHESGGDDELPHQSLSGAGTNTHAQVDSHVGSSANPHSVTKAQVSLGNVTNDAQLKRAAADFSTFTQKATPVIADRLLIEDSADSQNKKYVTVGDLPSSSSSSIKMFQVPSYSGGQIIGDWPPQNIVLAPDPVVTDAAVFSWDGVDEVTILKAGNIFIVGGIGLEQTAGGGRTISRLVLMHQPSGSSYTSLWGSERFLYIRNNTDGNFGSMVTNSATAVGVGDKICMQANRESGSGTLVIDADTANLQILWEG